MAVLDSIQERLDKAMSLSFATQSDKIEPIINELTADQSEDMDEWIPYWTAYGYYHSAIFYMNMEQNDKAEELTEAAISTLEEIAKPNAEHHVLLGSSYSLAITFSTIQAVILSSKAEKQYQKALGLAPNNLRAHLAIGRSDYYKPVMWGGGKKVESMLTKALSLPVKDIDSPYAPTWGKDQVYIYLVRYYQREARTEDAKLYVQRGLKAFPSDYELNMLREEL